MAPVTRRYCIRNHFACIRHWGVYRHACSDARRLDRPNLISDRRRPDGYSGTVFVLLVLSFFGTAIPVLIIVIAFSNRRVFFV
ncbi:MAG: hypothetical protein CM1200mP18_14390 [Gammaproteobacteria bacterium]|nr:MAG: hypothetical protein CM1200mP18_14390 [Gammaproteobacteria bacterium]